MRRVKIVACGAMSLALSILLLGGCASNRQARRGQGMPELQKTIETQQTEIAELKRSVEATTSLLFEVAGQLEECQAQLPDSEKKKQSAEVTKKPTRRQVSRTKSRTKTSSRTQKPIRKAGCRSCRQKRSKS